MHCGKAGGYHCKSNDECSSKICNNTCSQQSKRHYDNSDRFGNGLIFGIFFFCLYTNICICHGINYLLLSFLHKGKKKINIKYCAPNLL